MKLLVIRPEPDGERTAQALRARGHDVLLAPLTRIVPMEPDLGSGPWAALLVTSANALRALENHPQRRQLGGLPVLAVGDRSAAAARQAGFADVTSADGTAEELAALAAARYRGTSRPLLWLAGADRATNLRAVLAAKALQVEMHVIYQSVTATDLPPAAATMLRAGTLDGVLHYSRRGADAYLAAAARAGLSQQAVKPSQFCLSARIAQPLVNVGAENIVISQHPNEESLLQTIDSP